jgi:hypothetical protein
MVLIRFAVAGVMMIGLVIAMTGVMLYEVEVDWSQL